MKLKRVIDQPESLSDDAKERNIQVSLMKLKDFIDTSSKDQEEFDNEYAKHMYLVNELDDDRKEEFWTYLDHNRARVKREKRDVIEKECLNEARNR